MISFVIVLVVAFAIYRFDKELKESYLYAGRVAAPLRSKVLPIPQAYRDILQKYFLYYRQLDDVAKTKFVQKVCQFIYGKRFIPRNVDQVTMEARVLIAATAVQLTFGLTDVYLQHFDKILVYPNDYYSSITKRYHKGEVNPRFGIIVLSWQSFVDGFIYPNDSINLGLHEMAHALRLENIIKNDEYQFFDEELVNEFDAYAQKLCHVENWNDTFFRPYACANEHEFFAVAVENFFERPHEFKNALPELYKILSKLLNQDPTLLRPLS
ncbi:zinc-dependent peptidase [Chryseolinea sp. H1M3-3]|uniref:zinc-dependent peptidase n=1 Tax=Chryseolinea sp. H1M3-3 TaxID=3034144 RepID=UPI0023EDF04C|nr:zinc-dependent peptidase [Chryseolinea sp. H1M3-3]